MAKLEEHYSSKEKKGGLTYLVKEESSPDPDFSNHVRGRITIYEDDSYLSPQAPFEGIGSMLFGVDREGQRARIVDVEVIDSYKQRGLASILVKMLEERLCHYGVSQVRGISLPEAEGFWLKKGYSLNDKFGSISKDLDCSCPCIVPQEDLKRRM